MSSTIAKVVRVAASFRPKPAVEFCFTMPILTQFMGECLTRVLFNAGRRVTRKDVDSFNKLRDNKRRVRFVIQLWDDGPNAEAAAMQARAERYESVIDKA